MNIRPSNYGRWCRPCPVAHDGTYNPSGSGTYNFSQTGSETYNFSQTGSGTYNFLASKFWPDAQSSYIYIYGNEVLPRSCVIPLCIVVWAHVTAIFKLTISSRIFHQNTQFNMYTTTSKQQESSTYKDSHSKSFITTNFDKFHREAFAKGNESRWNFKSVFPSFSAGFPLQFFDIDQTHVLLKYLNKTHFLICT